MAPILQHISIKQRLQIFYVSGKSQSRAFRVLFDSGAQLSYVSPEVKVFLNLEIKVKQ